ncbi:L,D-transpeptidase [Bifidobacterium avesanii]|uniref:L,D-transpeptidase family protein n=1 Tax=Bifidobacterium avesanii TaxID=1798157 RepID=A0A7K3TIZ3_9BIFI|nr:L,D-transpeptidase [Bifidobacterium avesanii]KAB8292602.1 peptidoglycan-binding protein [Bifidobacterium avesanii]NEG78570.1 L,D-transpeptidase family protein [Bifidobacterium avesanii]
MANDTNDALFDPERTAYLPPLPVPGGAAQSHAHARHAEQPAFEALFAPSAPESIPPEGIAGHAAGAAAVSGARRRHVGLIVTLCVFAALLVALVGGFFGARAYFADRVAPGVSFGGTSLAGMTADEARNVVAAKADESKIAITASDGKTATVSLKDLGVTADVDGTVMNLLNAKSGGTLGAEIARINPWASSDVPLSLSTDKLALANALTERFVHEDDRAVASTVAYADASSNFAVTAGRDGQSPIAQPVEQAVAAVAERPGTVVNASVTYESVAMPVSVGTAQQAADQANARLASKLVVNNGSKKSFTVPAAEIAKWIGFDTDPEQGTVTLKYDDAAVKSYLEATLPNELKQDMVKASVVTNKAGAVMTTLREGVDGVTVTGVDDAVTAVTAALHSGESATSTVKTETTKFETESRAVDYDSPNGDPHVVVNLSEQKVYAYKGSTLVNTFLTSTGKLSTPSDNGTFFVYIKYESKTMRGADYVTPNVPWAIFYNQGEALHGAPWNPDGIAKGEPRSHGCVNMNVADAKWVYDFLPVGAMVQVVGTTPTAAVRAS